jgi:hypothetical protein
MSCGGININGADFFSKRYFLFNADGFLTLFSFIPNDLSAKKKDNLRGNPQDYHHKAIRNFDEKTHIISVNW